MKAAFIAMLCLAVAGCSQTADGTNTSATATAKPAAGRPGTQKATARKDDACRDAMQAQTNAAMLGGALGMVGSLGGFGGRGGMVAGQVASTAGNVVATSQSAKARAGVQNECY